jgi:protein involved in polysaccharide export with SLBB domain
MALPLLGLLSSCATSRYYNQRTMFQLTKGADGVVDTAKLRRAVNRTARNYTIHSNDLLNIQVYTNKGEKLIDPNGELRFGLSGGGASSVTTTPSGSGSSRGGAPSSVPGGTQFVVQADGTVRLPLVDRVVVRGLSLIQADSVLRRRYSEFYKEPFIKTAVTNNRVIILGAPGGQVISLANDNMNLLEVLALAGGPDGGGGGSTGIARNGGRIDNIRIIRGDLKNPQVQFINLNTLEGMRRGNLQVEPNDIIYIQPVRRPLIDNLVDAAPVLGLASTLLSTLSLIYTLARVR